MNSFETKTQETDNLDLKKGLEEINPEEIDPKDIEDLFNEEDLGKYAPERLEEKIESEEYYITAERFHTAGEYGELSIIELDIEPLSGSETGGTLSYPAYATATEITDIRNERHDQKTKEMEAIQRLETPYAEQLKMPPEISRQLRTWGYTASVEEDTEEGGICDPKSVDGRLVRQPDVDSDETINRTMNETDGTVTATVTNDNNEIKKQAIFSPTRMTINKEKRGY